jgi:hypothetical protein
LEQNTTTHPNVINRRARIKTQVTRLEIIPGFSAPSLFSVADIVQWELKKIEENRAEKVSKFGAPAKPKSIAQRNARPRGSKGELDRQ